MLEQFCVCSVFKYVLAQINKNKSKHFTETFKVKGKCFDYNNRCHLCLRYHTAPVHQCNKRFIFLCYTSPTKTDYHYLHSQSILSKIVVMVTLSRYLLFRKLHPWHHQQNTAKWAAAPPSNKREWRKAAVAVTQGGSFVGFLFTLVIFCAPNSHS